MLPPGSGLGIYKQSTPKVIRLLRQGCTNRPFYHIVVAMTRAHQSRPVIEQVGSFDPLPNEHNEKLVAINYERLQYWIGNGADMTKPVAQLLGMSGFYPIHPSSYVTAWNNRRILKQQAEASKESETTDTSKEPVNQ